MVQTVERRSSGDQISDDASHALANGESNPWTDLSVRVVSVGDSNLITDSSLIVRRLAEVQLVVCGSPEYLAKRGRPVHPSDLVGHSCLHFYDSPWGRQWHFVGPNGPNFKLTQYPELDQDRGMLVRWGGTL